MKRIRKDSLFVFRDVPPVRKDLNYSTMKSADIPSIIYRFSLYLHSDKLFSFVWRFL